LKSVQICQSYRKNKSGTIFMAHGVEIIVIVITTRASKFTNAGDFWLASILLVVLLKAVRNTSIYGCQ